MLNSSCSGGKLKIGFNVKYSNFAAKC